MAVHLSTYDRIFGLRRFPPGRLLTVLLAMRSIAEELGVDGLNPRLAEARLRAIHYITLRTRRRAQRVARGGGDARRIDRVIDDDIVEIARVARREAERFPESEAGRAAARLVEAFFQQGVAGIVQLPYDEELAVVEVMMPTMRRDHADAIRLLALERYVARIEAHLPKYRDALSPDALVGSAELGAAYEAMQISLLRVLAWIFGVVDEPSVQRRLLEPVLSHDDQLAAIYAARRRGAAASADDVSPDALELDAEAQAALEAEAEARREAGEPAPGPDGAGPADALDGEPPPGEPVAVDEGAGPGEPA